MQYPFLMSQDSAARREHIATRNASATETAQNVSPLSWLYARDDASGGEVVWKKGRRADEDD